MNHHVPVWLPSCVDPYSIKGNGEQKFKIAWVVSQVILSTHGPCGYVSLNSRWYKSQIGHRAWRRSQEVLRGLGSFKKNDEGRESYQKGEYNKQWKPNESIMSQLILRHDLPMPIFAKSSKSKRVEAARLAESSHTEIQRYIGDTIEQGVTLDPAWPNALNELKPAPDVKNESYRRACIERSALDIANGNYSPVRVGTTGRHTSCITNLSSHVRPYLRLFGENVVEIDLGSSQPYFLAGCLWKNPDMRDAVQDGSFYERINDELSFPYDMTTDRKKFKQVFMAVAYANPDKTGGRDYTLDPDYKHADFIRAMDRAYYSFSDFLRQYRLSHGNTALVNKLQRLESGVFIQRVVKSFIGKVPVIPIHDAILCRKSDIHTVSDKLRLELIKATGLEPKLGTE